MSDLSKHLQKAREIDQAGELCRQYIAGTHDTKTAVPPHVRQMLVDALEAGYRVWVTHLSDPRSHPFFLQKANRGPDGTCWFFVNLHFWDLGLEFPDRYNGTVSLSAEVQFNQVSRHGEDSRCLDVKIHPGKDDTLASIEKEFEKLYCAMECFPYDG